MKLISKTKLKALNDCSLQFFWELNNPELKKYSSDTKFSFNIGNQFEAQVKSKYPNGIPVLEKSNIDALKRTESLIKQESSNVIFESAFSSNNIIVRSDIISKNENGDWTLIEIKSGTKLKKEYLLDILIQYWTIKNSGFPIAKAFICHVNKKASKNKNSSLTKMNDLTGYCEENKGLYDRLITKSKFVSQLKKAPRTKMGSQCQNCPFHHICFKDVINDPVHVYNLPDFGYKWEAIKHNIFSINDLHFKEKYKDYLKNNKIAYKALKTNKPTVHSFNLKKEFDKIKYPINIMDFEGVGYSSPLFKNSKPYEINIVEVSHLVIGVDNKLIKENIFIQDSGQYNKETIAKKIIDFNNNEGSILVWDENFEINQINYLINDIKDQEIIQGLIEVKSRIIDLQFIFTKNVYDPAFLGSSSLKVLAPILTKRNHFESGNIKNGSQINNSYLEFINETNQKRKFYLYEELAEYGRADVFSVRDLYSWIKFFLKLRR